jgi:hypothetical protein
MQLSRTSEMEKKNSDIYYSFACYHVFISLIHKN